MKTVLFVLMAMVSFKSWAQDCAAGSQAFQNSILPKLQKDCARCHDGRRTFAPGFIAVPPLQTYKYMQNYVNFSKPDQSVLVARSGNSHCGTSACDAQSGAEMLKLVKQWWDSGEQTCDRIGKNLSPEMVLPKDLPTHDKGFQTFRFALDQLGPDFAGVQFQIEAQNFSDGVPGSLGAYRFKSPRFVNGKNPIFVKGIKLLLDNVYEPVSSSFAVISRTASFVSVKNVKDVTSASPVLSGHSVIVIKNAMAEPKVRVAFEEIRADKSTVCFQKDKFAAQVMKSFNDLACNQCHNSNAKEIATQIFNMNMPAEQVCQITGELAQDLFLNASPILSFPTRGTFGHQQLTEAQRASYFEAVKTWIEQ